MEELFVEKNAKKFTVWENSGLKEKIEAPTKRALKPQKKSGKFLESTTL